MVQIDSEKNFTGTLGKDTSPQTTFRAKNTSFPVRLLLLYFNIRLQNKVKGAAVQTGIPSPCDYTVLFYENYYTFCDITKGDHVAANILLLLSVCVE